jgi:serine/threonine protein kinase
MRARAFSNLARLDVKTVQCANVTEPRLGIGGDVYDVCETIGQGSSAGVYRALCRSSGEQVALKVVRTTDEEHVARARAEFLLLQSLDHPGIVRAIDFYVRPECTVLALSFHSGKPLGSAVRQLPAKRLTETIAHRPFVLLLRALDYLHQRRIVHRDVKPGNVMVSSDFSDAQLIDFNIAHDLKQGAALSPRCSLKYASPEVLKGDSPSETSDTWGAGLCLHLMLFGRCPSARRDGSIKLSESSSAIVSVPCMATLKDCLAIEMTMRPSPMTLLQRPWVLYGPGAGSLECASSFPPPERPRSCSFDILPSRGKNSMLHERRSSSSSPRSIRDPMSPMSPMSPYWGDMEDPFSPMSTRSDAWLPSASPSRQTTGEPSRQTTSSSNMGM